MNRLSRLARAKVLWRSLFIQAGFNPEGLQTLGLLYTLAPALQELYPDEAARQAAVARHLTTFNTHPYISAAIVGGILHHEERVACGESSPEAVTHFKATLMGPLAALGDGFFWLSLRPAAGAVAAASAPWLGAWAALLGLLIYNGVAMTLRARFFWFGYAHGDAVVSRLGKVRLPVWGQRLRSLAALAAGGVGAFYAVKVGAEAGPARAGWVGLVALVLGGFSTVAVRKVPAWLLLYGGAAVALAWGVWG